MFSFLLCVLLLFSAFSNEVSGELWCYACVSSEPGCEENYVDWRIHHAITCPKSDDKCVKIIERKGVDTFITRDCLSNLESQRKDIPADRYDGCRKAAEQPKLSVFVENHISQLEIKSQHYEDVTYCFCYFDQWCNVGSRVYIKPLLIITSVLCLLHLFFT